MSQRNRWALVLAAGEGTRLRSLTTGPGGVSVPKQFCAFRGGRSLLRLTLERARRLVPADRIACVVAAGHRTWWTRELAGWPDVRLAVQPRNRGTAAGVVLPLLAILDQDPQAVVLVLPSDHFVADETTLNASTRSAYARVERDRDRVVLLGITPDEPDPQYGWILPGRPDGDGLYRVRRFVEKPERTHAVELMVRGAVWNGFLIAAAGRTLLHLVERRRPDLVAALRSTRPTGDLEAAYRDLDDVDLSRDVLQGAESRLRVMPVPECGWTDLGTPDRVLACVRRFGARRAAGSGTGAAASRVDLYAAAAARAGLP